MSNYVGANLQKEVAEKHFEIKGYVTGSQIEAIIIDGIEGGINYWACIDNTTDAFKAYEGSDLSLSEKIVDIILSDGEVNITDTEGDEEPKYALTLERLLRGIGLNNSKRPFDCDLENSDATTVDCIIQYAIYDDVIFS